MKNRLDVSARGPLMLLLFLTVITTSSVACTRDPFSNRDGGTIPVTELLRRTSTSRWETKRSTKVGVQVEVPSDLCGFAEHPSLGMVIRMHTVPPPLGVLDDKKCLLEIKIERMNKDDFAGLRATDPQIANKGDSDYELRRWNYQRHDSISRFDVDHFTYYRYDLECLNGEFVWALASVINVHERGVSLYEKEDDESVRRVLGSLRCLEVRR